MKLFATPSLAASILRGNRWQIRATGRKCTAANCHHTARIVTTLASASVEALGGAVEWSRTTDLTDYEAVALNRKIVTVSQR
jgi:hypothetical protein